MSVLIKGMEMPKDCVSCDLCDNDGYCYALYGDSLWDVLPDGAVYFPDGWKYVGCPLVEVPEPHGRLIDADALKETLDYYICEANWGDEVNKGLRWVKDEFINSENTVIEAEGSENYDD